ncbi:polyketide cyclase / dehydrase and lipid transport [bacterium BMS3Bbin12]|nr:polyketide cyclase / dehydrase and lipid transport [bacterium BMS3Abin12]GBE47465.1 polyketide cyclase / dehydrase and lipid transport [bacterium BMS3Bbin12]GBE51461.1 polyketide cyclase / dehydrase and lipid transport [bacterium BMS3Bbin13]
MRARPLLVLILSGCTLFAGAAHAAGVVDLQVERHGDRYRLAMRMNLEMPARELRAIITDYAHLARLNPAIVESKVLARKNGVTRVRTVVRGCIAFFCFDVHQVQDVQVRADGEIVAVTVPALSDFRYGLARWRIVPRGARACRLDLEAVIVPSFWVPPIIGPWLIRHKMRDEALRTAATLERLASAGAGPGAHPVPAP